MSTIQSIWKILLLVPSQLLNLHKLNINATPHAQTMSYDV